MLSNAKVSKDSMCRVADGVRPAVFVRAKKALRAGQEVSFKYIEKNKLILGFICHSNNPSQRFRLNLTHQVTLDYGPNYPTQRFF